jgi:long-chain acyl-CoA synthetase
VKAANLLEVIEHHAQHTPEHPALIWQSDNATQELTYRKLWQRIMEFANGLEQIGVHKQTKVGILSHNNPCQIISDLAVLSLGAVSIPIDPYLPKSQVLPLLDRFDVEILIAETAELSAQLKHLPTFKNRLVVIFDEDNREQSIYSFTTLLEKGASATSIDDHPEHRYVRQQDLATIVHTPGTWDLPKGVMLSHGNILHNISVLTKMFPISKHDVFTPLLPTSYIFERVFNLFYPLTQGATVILGETTDSLTAYLQATQPTVLLGTSDLYRQLKQELEEGFLQNGWWKKKVYEWAARIGDQYTNYQQKGFNWSVPDDVRKRYERAHQMVFSKLREQTGGRLRFLLCTGDVVDEELRTFFSILELPILSCYHMTECAGFVASQSLLQQKTDNVGHALPEHHVKQLTDGELIIQSPSVMMGYYKAPEKTTATIIDGWLQTGDRAIIDEQGHIQLMPRPPVGMVLTNGQTIIPNLLEEKLIESPYIQQAVVVGHMRKFLSVLLLPNIEAIVEFAKEENFPSEDLQEILQSQLVHSLIQREINKYAQELPAALQPKKFLLVEELLSLKRGTLTAFGHIRRWVIESIFQQELELLYQSSTKERISLHTNKE